MDCQEIKLIIIFYHINFISLNHFVISFLIIYLSIYLSIFLLIFILTSLLPFCKVDYFLPGFYSFSFIK